MSLFFSEVEEALGKSESFEDRPDALDKSLPVVSEGAGSFKGAFGESGFLPDAFDDFFGPSINLPYRITTLEHTDD